MFILSITAFVAAIVLGVFMALDHFSLREIPLLLAVAHGLLALAGLFMLILAGVRASFPAHTGAELELLLATAAAGAVLFGFDLTKRSHPSALVLLHGGAAVVSFTLLLASVISLQP